ncbi:MAG: outer membrane beta-barrel protein [Bacillota bacterium]
MKKTLLITLVAISLLLFSAFTAQAQIQQEEIDVYGGLFYTSLADDGLDDLNEEEDIDLTSSMGFKVGAKAPLSPKMDVGLEYARFSPSDDIPEVEGTATINVNAIRGVFTYNITQDENLPTIKLKGTPGYYFGELEYEIDNYEDPEPVDFDGNFGLTFGVEASDDVANNVEVFSDASYRILDLDIEDSNDNDVEDSNNDLDANGFEVGAGVAVSF